MYVRVLVGVRILVVDLFVCVRVLTHQVSYLHFDFLILFDDFVCKIHTCVLLYHHFLSASVVVKLFDKRTILGFILFGDLYSLIQIRVFVAAYGS